MLPLSHRICWPLGRRWVHLCWGSRRRRFGEWASLAASRAATTVEEEEVTSLILFVMGGSGLGGVKGGS